MGRLWLAYRLKQDPYNPEYVQAEGYQYASKYITEQKALQSGRPDTDTNDVENYG